MLSFVIKIAKEVKRATELDITVPALGTIIDNAELVSVEADPINISVIFNYAFFLFRIFHFFY